MSWLQHAIMYQIFIDRFAGCTVTTNGNYFMGGNLAAAAERLPYVTDMGFNTIWLSPFYQTSAYHGYHITDYEQVDNHFGTDSDLFCFIHKAHETGLRVIADFVPNHCSCLHPFFKEAQHDKTSSFFDWFTFEHWPDKYRCFLNFRELPKINLHNPDASAYLLSVVRKWIAFGFDGLRIDHAIGIPFDFLQRLRQTVLSEKPEAVIIGEVWAEGISPKLMDTLEIKRKTFRTLFGINQDDIQLDYHGLLDGVFDFVLRGLLLEYVDAPETKKEIVHQRILRHLSYYSPEYLPVGFLDNHDTDRFLWLCNNDKAKFEEAAKLLFSLKIPVVMYNGSERGMSQHKSLKLNVPFSDLQVRQPVNWQAADESIITFFKEQIALFKQQNGINSQK
jgi:glycosidase